MPLLEDPEQTLKCFFLAGCVGLGGQGTESSLFNVLILQFDEPLDDWEQLVESSRQQLHPLVPPSGVPSGLGLECVCVALDRSATGSGGNLGR